jgi:hypothetical protein
MHDWSDGEMKITSMLKKVRGGIVVLLIGIIVIILYASYTCPYTCRPGYIWHSYSAHTEKRIPSGNNKERQKIDFSVILLTNGMHRSGFTLSTSQYIYCGC